MKRKVRSVLLSKWIKTKVLLGSDGVRPYIPDTRKFNKTTLNSMLHSYNMVYVKPEIGTYGNGVIRVERLKTGEYSYQIDKKIKTFRDYTSLYQSLLKKTGKRSYLIQKGIHLVKYNKQRFDLRVMVQLSPKGTWETTGLIGRVAQPGKIVTN